MYDRILFHIKQLYGRFWFYPILLVISGSLLAAVCVHFDRQYFSEIQWHTSLLFSGNASAARSLLSAIAGALITVVAVTFSITILALQQAAAQHSPRVLEQFTRDRVNQSVLGLFIGTVAFALIVLRDVRDVPFDAASGGFVPGLSIAVALALTLFDLGLLVFFLHHVSDTLQVSTILRRIRKQLDARIPQLFPNPRHPGDRGQETYFDALERTKLLRVGTHYAVRAGAEGYLLSVDVEAMAKVAQENHLRFVSVICSISDYVVAESVVLHFWRGDDLDTPVDSALRQCFIVDAERSADHDPAFGIRQIVDIALRAISPGILDPTTAEECLFHLKGWLALLLHREMVPPYFEEGGVGVLMPRATFADYIALCFRQLRIHLDGTPHVQTTMEGVLNDLVALADGDRLQALKTFADERS